MRSILIATLLGAGIAAPALAQDTTAPFTGPRVEALVGWDKLKTSSNDDGVLYGVGAGYDVQVQGPRGPIFGIEAEVSDATSKACIGVGNAGSPRGCSKTGRDLYIGGRVGAPVLPKTLVYAKAGYVNTQFTRTIDSGTGAARLDKRNLGGWRLGAGVEYAIAPNMFVKTEYRISDYEKGYFRHQAVAGFGMRF